MLRLIALTIVRPLKVRRWYIGMLQFSMTRASLTSSRTIHKLCHHSGPSTQSDLTEV